MADDETENQWTLRLRLAVQRRHAGNETDATTARGDVWLLLRNVLNAYSRFHVSRQGKLSESEIQDIVSQKSLDLLLTIDSKKWRPDAENDAQVKGFISTVARNGVVDVLRLNSRVTNHPDPELLAMDNHSANLYSTTAKHPATGLEVTEFVTSLYGCIEKLSPRARKLWFFRVVYDLPSKVISAHPEIQMTVGNVDVALQRCRALVGDCMATKGMKLKRLPAGTYSALWELCNKSRDAFIEEESHG